MSTMALEIALTAPEPGLIPRFTMPTDSVTAPLHDGVLDWIPVPACPICGRPVLGLVMSMPSITAFAHVVELPPVDVHMLFTDV